jgi:hypothetical protein
VGDFMLRRSKRATVRAIALCALSAPPFTFATAHNWTGVVAGKIYSDAGNWSPSGVPGINDIGVFSSNNSATFNASAAVGYATVAGCS